MFEWTEEQVLQELDGLIEAVDALREETRFSAAHTRWLTQALSLLEEVFGANSRYCQLLASLEWSRSGGFMLVGAEALNPERALQRRHHEAYLQQLETARGLLEAAADELRRKGLRAVYQGKDTAPEASTIVKLLNLAERKLRKTIRAKPEAERQVQDAFENLLIGADIDYGRETEAVEYSSKVYRPDFSVHRADLAIEIKFCGRDGREKELIAEINDDILAYKTKFGNLLFVVYDLGFIRDVDRFAGHFERNENVVVRVIKH